MIQYCVPWIRSIDTSSTHFFRNQATCDPNTILDGQTLSLDTISCGTLTGSQAAFCLSGPADVSSNLNGLIIQGIEGGGTLGTQVQIDSCVADFNDPACGIGETGYRCNFTGNIGGGSECVFQITCPDGALITQCPTGMAC